MKLRHLALALALLVLAASATLLLTPAAQAIPNNPPAPYVGACGYLPYMTLGSSCTGAGYIVGSATSLSACQATETSYIFTALYSHGCDAGDWTFECRPSKWCKK